MKPRPAVRATPGPGSVTVLHLPPTGGTTQERDVWVYRPAGPDRADLPVVYFLHGTPGTPADVFGTGLAAFLDEAFSKGAAPFVVAAPDGQGESHPDSEWADASDGSDQIESFLISQVIPAVEGEHRRSAHLRAIAGFSMGGYGAMNLALRHVGLFSQVVSIAGYFHVDDPDGVFGGNPRTRAANAPDRHLAAASNLRILLLDGEQDQEPVVKGEAERFWSLLDDAGVPATLQLTPGDHSWQYVASVLGAITTFLEAGFASL